MKLWGGRFEKETNKVAAEFQSSIRIDKRLYKEDILGSVAHTKTLIKCGILPMEEGIEIERVLFDILLGIENKSIKFDYEAEDIHSNIEALLTQRLGVIGKKVHTGRSRNDQVALDLRMYLLKETDEIIKYLILLEQTIITLSKENVNTILPGFTHLQKAQPITLAHHLMAYFQMFRRDVERLLDSKKRIAVMPLGAGALAGTSYPLDRNYTAKILGFKEITENSLDAVSDRDFVIELTADLSIIMMHLSRFCEEIIIWVSQEYSYIELADEYSTGSSIMPQKKNPDFAELIRGKTGRVYGSLITLLTVMKGLPLSYNKDMQEDKEAVFDSIDTVKGCLNIFEGMIATMKINTSRMYTSAQCGYINATDLADYLVRKGVAFRDAHEIVGKIVRFGIEKHIYLSEVCIEDYKSFSPLIGEDIFEAISLEKCVSSRNIIGGPAPEAVTEAIKNGELFIEKINN